ARRTRLPEHVWRWCRRNPALAGLAAAVAVLLVVLGIGWWINDLLRGERDIALANQFRAEEAEKETREAQREIKIRAHLARAAAYRHSRQRGERFQAL